MTACAAALVVVPSATAAPFTLELSAPASATYGEQLTLRGRIAPALADAPVSIVRNGIEVAALRTRADGTFVARVRVDGPATYAAAAGELVSASVAPAVLPRVTARVVGTGVVGQPLRLEARVEPTGPLRVRVTWGRRGVSRDFVGAARMGLPTRAATSFAIRVEAAAPTGWTAAKRTLSATVVEPNLAAGARGPGVRALQRRLRDLHYALPSINGVYDVATTQAVYAFQKVNGLARSGRVDARLWRRLVRARVPRARYGGDHIEISKGRQVLFVVRGGTARLVVHVSTGATGNTPLGTFHVYRKVVGWDWVLWYPQYFLRGFAIHGYPSVPAYPASHGCVRVPMWIAPRLFSANRWGSTVYLYW